MTQRGNCSVDRHVEPEGAEIPSNDSAKGIQVDPVEQLEHDVAVRSEVGALRRALDHHQRDRAIGPDLTRARTTRVSGCTSPNQVWWWWRRGGCMEGGGGWRDGGLVVTSCHGPHHPHQRGKQQSVTRYDSDSPSCVTKH